MTTTTTTTKNDTPARVRHDSAAATNRIGRSGHAMRATALKNSSEESVQVMPDALSQELDRLEHMFRIDQAKLKQITQRFTEQLDEGLQEEGKNIPMALTWVLGYPTGHERGSFLGIDLGGTNVRICWITLRGREESYDMIQHKYTLPEELKHGTAEELWDTIAYDMEKFIEENELAGSKGDPLDLAFTFSYPATQHYIDHGILQRWTKGWDIKGAEGEDVALQLRAAIAKRNLPIRLVALVNDTTGAMIASAYTDPKTIIGAIFGTGCNAAYMERCSSIPKLTQPELRTSSAEIAINCEYGAFDNERIVLPFTPYDHQIDLESPRPGQQSFEKLSAGLYLGEIFRLVFLDLCEHGLLMQNQDVSKLQTSYCLDTGFLSALENDTSPHLLESKALFKDALDLDLSEHELYFAKRVAEIIAIRGARLCACGIAAICRRKNISTGHVAADGSVANKHPKFKNRWAKALGEILDWNHEGGEDTSRDPIIMKSAEDASGVGAAVIAAMTKSRWERGERAGIQGL